MKIVVLGAGRVGNAMARDLHVEGKWNIEVADYSKKALSLVQDEGIKTKYVDLSSIKGIKEAVKNADLVIGALPGFMGFECVKNVISQKKNIVDISFFPEDPMALDAMAKKNGVTCAVDAGIAPGCSNLIAGRMSALLDSIENFVCLVGGLPVERSWPYEYKAPFSPIDVIEEYTRTARLVKNGKVVEMAALTEPELVEFSGIGTLEAFNTDGLRTLLKTIKAKNMSEKTMRYPGHIEKMKVLRETGFFSYEPVKIGGVSIRPIDLTTKLLFPMWSFAEGEPDLTVMKIVVEGTKNGRKIRHTYDLFDTADLDNNVSSMARTTGYTATAVARLIIKGKLKKKGVLPLELIGSDLGSYLFIMSELGKRGVVFEETIN
jgi:lysine 6-dehydrogenase